MVPSNLIPKVALALASLMYVDSKHYLSNDISEIITGLKTRKVVLSE
jgi:hypothetical protein